MLTEFCQTSAVHNLQNLVQFKVSLNPWNPQKIAGLEVLEMIPRFRCYTWRPSKWKGVLPLPESSVQTCLLFSFHGPVAGFQILSVFYSQRHCKPKVTESRPSDATMSPKTSAQKDPKEHAVHVKRQIRLDWASISVDFANPLLDESKNSWSMGIVAWCPGNASLWHLQSSTGDRMNHDADT